MNEFIIECILSFLYGVFRGAVFGVTAVAVVYIFVKLSRRKK